MFTMEAKKNKYQRVLNTKVPASARLNLSSPVIFPTKKKILNLAVKFYGMKFCMKFLRTAVSGSQSAASRAT